MLQADPVAGHHVFGQSAQQMRRQRGLPVPCRGRVLEHHVSHQLLAIEHQRHGFAHRRVLSQTRFDFAHFDPQAAQLDLMVEAAQVLNHPVHPLAHKVAGAVQAFALIERAWHKTLGGQARAAMIIACQTGTAQVQLARHPQCHGGQVGIQHQRAQVGDGQANRHTGGAFIDTGPVGHVDGGFGRAVQVVQLGARQFGEHLLLRVDRQRLTAAHDAAQAGALLNPGLVDKGLQHRRHEMHGADLMLAQGLNQAQRLAMLARLRHYQPRAGEQRPKEFPHGHVKTERGFLQHRVVLVQTVGLLHPA